MAGKFYTVWEGREPGVYDNWDDCLEQVEGFPGARYKSFNTREAAVKAFREDADSHIGLLRKLAGHRNEIADYTAIADIRLDAIAVDGACSGNPGKMEYRCVRVADGVEIFHMGPLEGGTNNIAEYLAIIHAAAMLQKQGNTITPIYSDSRTAMGWIRRGQSNTTITPNTHNTKVLELLHRADTWLAANRIPNPLLKWDTDAWGEIPADFNRK